MLEDSAINCFQVSAISTKASYKIMEGETDMGHPIPSSGLGTTKYFTYFKT